MLGIIKQNGARIWIADISLCFAEGGLKVRNPMTPELKK